MKIDSNNFQNCMSVQPRRYYPSPSKLAKELATELLDLVDGDTNKAMATIREIMYYHPNKSVEWYYERAIVQIYRFNRH